MKIHRSYNKLDKMISECKEFDQLDYQHDELAAKVAMERTGLKRTSFYKLVKTEQ